MIDVVVELLSEYGIMAGGGAAIVWVGLWLRRMQAIAIYLKVASVLAIAFGLGALAGVVNTGRALELARAGWELLPLVVGVIA